MILLLDNYDSFVHNLARYVRRLGCRTRVVRSDQMSTQACEALSPSAVILSPGPRRPENAGCSVELVRHLSSHVPILGVCLGHQAIAAAFGGSIRQCGPRHGLPSRITHDGAGLFEGLPSPFTVGRYHSLAVDESALPDELQVTARSDDDGVIMGLRHRTRPVYGVQFHPESVLTDHGLTVLRNFIALTRGKNRLDRAHPNGLRDGTIASETLQAESAHRDPARGEFAS
ncbi:MAG: anthranilate synthase component II [Rubripirellula sp.]